MAIIGFNLLKINTEVKEPLLGKVNISNNVAIKDVEKKEITFGSNKQDILRFITAKSNLFFFYIFNSYII
jgi:hypothetical protein